MIIKFNLLPKKELVKPEEVEGRYIFFKIFSLVFIVIVVTITVEGFHLKYTLDRLKDEKREKEEKLAEYQKIAQKVKFLEKEMEEAKKHISTIITLKKNQGIALQRLEALIEDTHKNRVAFTELSVNSSQAEMNGISSNLENIANYLKSLESRKDIVKEVPLKKIEKKEAYLEFKAGVMFNI